MSDDLHHLAAAYALDALDDAERRAFEAHYPSCHICAAEVDDFKEIAGRLATATTTEPPAGLKAKTMAEISETRQLLPPPPAAEQIEPTVQAKNGSGPSRRVLAAAAAVMIVLGATAIAVLPNADDTEVNELVEATDAESTTLEPLTSTQLGSLEVVWSNERDQVAVIGSNLPDPGPDQVYALWLLIGDSVAPAGLFTPSDGSISTVLDVDDINPSGWGITIEPAAGSAQPTTDVIFAGTI